MYFVCQEAHDQLRNEYGTHTEQAKVHDLFPDIPDLRTSIPLWMEIVMLPCLGNAIRNINCSDLTDVHELGQGAFGMVWRCRWQGASYAMKQLLRPQAPMEIPYEARLAARLTSHPHVMQFHFVAVVCDAARRNICMAFELLDGPLEDLLPRRKSVAPPGAPPAAVPPVPCTNLLRADGDHQRVICSNCKCEPCVKFVLDLAIQLTSAVVHLHKLKVVHRDLALKNVLYIIDRPADGSAPRVRAKLGDFGHARELVGHFVLNEQAGRWEHQAIEQLASESGDISSFETDVWALGVCIWELFRDPDDPYKGAHYMRMKAALQVSSGAESELVLPFLRLSETGAHRLPKPANCPDSVYTLLLRCWAADFNQRDTAAAVLCKLEDIHHRPL